jgi:hypothetical protein
MGETWEESVRNQMESIEDRNCADSVQAPTGLAVAALKCENPCNGTFRGLVSAFGVVAFEEAFDRAIVAAFPLRKGEKFGAKALQPHRCPVWGRGWFAPA